MNKFKKHTGFYLATVLLGLLSVFALSSCSDDDDDEVLEAGYGYVQFKLYKSLPEGETTRTMVDKLDKLNDAKKIKVLLQHKGATIEQTLMLNAYNEDNAEFCLRSDKLKLLSGDYRIIGYFLYDKVDKELIASEVKDNLFTIVAGGMKSHTLTVDAVERGRVNFKVMKNFVATRAQETPEYAFDQIKCISVRVKNLFTQELTYIKNMQVKFTEGFKEDHSWTSFGECDSIVWLKAGSYQVTEYTTFSDKKGKSPLETATVNSAPTFVVKANELTEDAEVPVKLSETAEYIKDYQALKAIWEALDGENWSYIGEREQPGCNWDFENRDIDMWGSQPGVQLLDNGRVASLILAGFGPRGVVPDAIGQLTELRVLYLGTHSELVGGTDFSNNSDYPTTDAKRKALRMDYYNQMLKHDVRADLSDILVEGINANPNMKKIAARIDKKDVQAGQLTNGITGISAALKRCVNLEQFYIANAPIAGGDNFFVPIAEDSPYYEEEQAGELKWSNLKALLDVEIYNCPKLGEDGLPMQMLSNLPELQALNVSCNPSIPGEKLLENFTGLAVAREEGMEETEEYTYNNSSLNYNKLQMIYMGYNSLEETPRTYALKNMVKLGLLDLSNNKLKKVYPFTKSVNLVQFFLDNNQLTEIPHDEDGYFFGYADVESFSVSNNLLTELPDIFNANSKYIMEALDFSNNLITKLENGDNHRGYNATEIDLSYNRFETFPGRLFNAGSPIASINLAGNGMTSIPEGSLKGKYSARLQSVDLTYNKLTDLPSDFMATTCPYLYGIDLSYNCFSKFPTEPLSSGYLNVFGIRHQRDAEGNRILREWPTGLYTCPSLVRFFIGSNDLRKIDDQISPYIRIFEIKDNPNISVDISPVCNYIKAGLYILIYDKTQDIRGCDALDLE